MVGRERGGRGRDGRRLSAGAGGEALAVVGDVAVEADVRPPSSAGCARFGGAPRALQQRGRALASDQDLSVLETDGSSWDRVMAINLKGMSG